MMHLIDQQLKHSLAGNFSEAWSISEKLEAMGPEGILDPHGKKNPEMWFRHQFNRAWFYLQRGDYQTGSKMLEYGRHINVYGGQPLMTAAPMYNPEVHNIKGKSIIISLEGGLGDEIIHVRFAQSYKRLGADRVIVACSPELQPIFSRVDGVDKCILRNEAHTVSHDYWIPGFSSGWVAGHTYEDLPNKPYINVSEMSEQIWSGIVCSDKKRVGIRWAGNPKFEHQQFRRFSPQFMFELAKYDGVQLYSLQRDNNLEQLPDSVIDLQKWLLGWDDTIAAMHHMDLIITSCTSVAHMAAAMGKETWILPPILPYQTWTPGAPESNKSPWYPSVTLYRQQEYEKWNKTFQSLYRDFEARYDLEAIEHPNHDHVPRKLNLGCGTLKMEGFHNVDRSLNVNADEIVDLEQTPWPWEDNEFSHVVAKDILEHLGETPSKFLAIIKEMYRVSKNGAVWEIQTPHWRSDNALNDPTHVRSITPQMLDMFNKKYIMWTTKEGMSHSPLAFDIDVDFEVCDTQHEFTHLFKDKIKSGEITQEELNFAFNTLNNVAESTRYLVEVHKPGRYTVDEYRKAVSDRQDVSVVR
jgi:predicted SAM-dependent methyltransferase